VADCAVFPVKDPIKGEVPVGLVIVNHGSTVSHDDLKHELVQSVRNHIGAVASFKKVAVVKALPKTRSGKILRSTMAKIANGQEYTVTPTIEDPKVFDYLAPIIQDLVRGVQD
jgi:propionyl-CoA synthetase